MVELMPAKQRSARWISVPERDADARVTAAQVHFIHVPVTESGVVEFRLEMWSRRCDGRRPRAQAHTEVGSGVTLSREPDDVDDEGDAEVPRAG